jgi:hypothetical protein
MNPLHYTHYPPAIIDYPPRMEGLHPLHYSRYMVPDQCGNVPKSITVTGPSNFALADDNEAPAVQREEDADDDDDDDWPGVIEQPLPAAVVPEGSFALRLKLPPASQPIPVPSKSSKTQ